MTGIPCIPGTSGWRECDMEVGEFNQMQCLLWLIQTAKFSRANVHWSSMKILHVLLQKKPKISPQTRPASCPFHRMRKRSSQQGPRSCGFCLPRISGFSLWRGVDSPRSICTDHMKQYPLLRRGKKIAYHPTPLLPGPDLPPGHRAVTVKFPTIEKEESTLTTEGLWLLQGPPLTQFPLLSLALRPHCPSSSPPPQGWSGKESPSLIPLNVPPLPPPHH